MASQNYKDLVIARLRDHSGLPEKEIETIKWFMIASHYFRQPDHTGGVMIPGTVFYRRDGTAYTFEDVPLKAVLESVDLAIGTKVASDRRSEVWYKVFQGIPGAKKKPDWEIVKPVDNPRADPDTEFSVSRAAPGEVKSNTDIIAALLSATHLNEEDGFRIGALITWWDSIDSKGNSGCFSFADGVRGGRLGRNHTLEDVPNHYVRDRVLHYINNELDEEERGAARKAVFPDLDEDELEQYSAAIVEVERETDGRVMKRPKKMKKGNKSKSKDKPVPQPKASNSKQPSSTLSGPTVVDAAPVTEDAATHANLFARVVGNRGIRSTREIETINKQALLLDSIPASTTDLTPRPKVARRSSWMDSVFHSVIKPGQKIPLPQEEAIRPGVEIDRDCDQIRAMIKILVTEGDWTLDQFRLALGGISRAALTGFLEKTGPAAGSRSISYELGWEFFKKRELLGLSLHGAGPTEVAARQVLNDLDANVARAKKHGHGVVTERPEKRIRPEDIVEFADDVMNVEQPAPLRSPAFSTPFRITVTADMVSAASTGLLGLPFILRQRG
ncbi:hypothetical protein FHL15_011222 [Xylaria flabelliformis]|uniref:DUF7726 domain-containing protein n=1 Tax=Xylaria flabelliformis TaxID=2512241 RepID=A0A553HIU8_9PEZI|nr:hypothetical protein FHL15_011222 [Xylaria flabelliformis]